MNAEMLEILREALLAYGAPALGAFVFIVALGVPLPGSMSLVAAGVLARQGHLALTGTVLLAFLGAVLGDSLGFMIGYYASESRRQQWSSRPRWQRATELFCRYGVWLVLLLRTVFTSVTLPFNLAAGISGLSYRRFLLFNLVGVILWVACCFGLGYVLGASS